MRISEQRLNQIINESIQESLNGMVSGFNAARHNYKGNSGQTFGNRVMNAANAGNQGYRLQEFQSALYDLKHKARELSESGLITDAQYVKIENALFDMSTAVSGVAHKSGINTRKRPFDDNDDIFDSAADKYFGK